MSRDFKLNLREREKMNVNSVFLDLTVVYRNDKRLKEFKSSLLRSSSIPSSNVEHTLRNDETKCSSGRTEKRFAAEDRIAENNVMLLSLHAF